MLEVSIYIGSFIAIWIGAGLIVKSVDTLSKRLHIPSFLISFAILGLATSAPEFAVGITALAEARQSIFVGNLLGGIILLFLFVIPLLAIAGKGLPVNQVFRKKTLLLCLFTLTTPAIFLLDKRFSTSEAIASIGLYLLVLYFIQLQSHFSENIGKNGVALKKIRWADFFRLLIGLVVVFVSARILVDETVEIATLLGVSQFLISLVIVSLGTNLPELFLALRAILFKKQDIAFGDYAGSAAANVLFMGIFTLMGGQEIILENNILPTFIFTALGLGLFYYFVSSKNNISRKEGIVLLIIYLLFLTAEVLA